MVSKAAERSIGCVSFTYNNKMKQFKFTDTGYLKSSFDMLGMASC